MLPIKKLKIQLNFSTSAKTSFQIIYLQLAALVENERFTHNEMIFIYY